MFYYSLISHRRNQSCVFVKRNAVRGFSTSSPTWSDILELTGRTRLNQNRSTSSEWQEMSFGFFSQAADEGGHSQKSYWVLQTFFYRRNDVVLTVHVFPPLNTLHKKMLSDRKLCLLLFVPTILSTVIYSESYYLKFYITEHLADKMLWTNEIGGFLPFYSLYSFTSGSPYSFLTEGHGH